MKYTDIAIVGGGLAGSIAGTMLGRAGISAVLIDPHPHYPPDFRVEKISGDEQVERFLATGIGEKILRAATHDGVNWIARFGYPLDKMPSHQYGVLYHDLVNAIRDEIPGSVELLCAKVTAVANSAERQKVTLSTGEVISARLVVLSNGLNVGLRHALGIERRIASPCHSISFAFDMVPVGRPAFALSAMTYFSERPSDRIPYITLFPIGDRMRANLFTYRDLDDPWIRQMRTAPVATLNAALPRLRRLTGDFDITGEMRIRPTDLYVSTGYRQPGVVLVGDAFETTCPVTGTGTDKVFVDVERLCNVHIPAWLATEGMDETKIAAFYDDPVKKACDAWSKGKAYSFRQVSIGKGPYWALQRWARFFGSLARGTLRRMLGASGAEPEFRSHSSSSSSPSSSSSISSPA